MDPKEAAVQSIGDALDALDTRLQSGDPPINSPEWHQLEDSREALDNKQQALVLADIQSDDAMLQAAATTIDEATKSLQADIEKQKTVDTIISDISGIAAAADTILKIV